MARQAAKATRRVTAAGGSAGAPDPADSAEAVGSERGPAAAPGVAGRRPASAAPGGPDAWDAWDAEHVRGLRRHLGASQSVFADRLGTRQQTVSEWETGSSRPRRMSRRLLHLVAEESGYYEAATDRSVGADDAQGHAP